MGFLNNPFIDQVEYRRQLEAACPGDPELLRAWLEGDWAVARGAYFASVLDEQRNAITPWDKIPTHHHLPWERYLAHDFGSSAPSVTYIVAVSPGATVNDQYFPSDSLVLVDELASNEPGRLNKGLGWTVPKLADAIKEMCDRWEVDAYGVPDDAIFAQARHSHGSISGWATMPRLLQDAGKPDVPGLSVARHCAYFWATVPYLARDRRRVEDVDPRGPDHVVHVVRYGCLRWHSDPTVVRISGI